MAIAHNAFVINDVMFGGDTAAVDDYIQRQSSQFDRSNPHLANDSVFIYAREVERKYNSAALRSMIEEALNSTRMEARPDVVTILSNLSELRQAQPVMQTYIMANKVWRKRFHRNLCQGYDGYEDDQPGVIGWGHRPYERVMDGVVEFTDDGYEYCSSSEVWANEHREKITQSERRMVLATWRIAEQIAKETDEDITDKHGGSS